jgi:hypothetical protein
VDGGGLGAPHLVTFGNGAGGRRVAVSELAERGKGVSGEECPLSVVRGRLSGERGGGVTAE